MTSQLLRLPMNELKRFNEQLSNFCLRIDGDLVTGKVAKANDCS